MLTTPCPAADIRHIPCGCPIHIYVSKDRHRYWRIPQTPPPQPTAQWERELLLANDPVHNRPRRTP